MNYLNDFVDKDKFIGNAEIYQVLINSIAQATWETNADGVIVNDSVSWREYTGQTYEAWLGFGGFGGLETVHPEEKEYALRKWLEAASSMKNFDIEVRIKGADGQWKWTKVVASPIFDSCGNVQKWVGINIDISQRKKIEEDLRQLNHSYRKKEEEYLEIIDSSTLGSFIHDLEKNEIHFSKQWKKRLGIEHLSPKDAVKAITEKSHPDDRTTMHEAYVSALRNREAKVSMEFRAKTVDSGYIWVLGQANIIYNEEGRPIKYLGTHMDIDERKQREMNLNKSLEIQDDVFSNISHELKTPLNVIFSANQLLELYFRNDSLREHKEQVLSSLSTIKQNCYRFTKLINNIIDLSKIKSGFFKLDRSNDDIVMVVEEIVDSVTDYINQRNLSILFDTNVEEKIIAFDAYKVERIMLNLISNAIKFTNPGGKIFVNLIDKDSSVEISVRDTGIGMEKKYLKNIFKRYHQIDKSLSRNTEGSGIGLSLVKSIVDLHGGKIKAYSKVGEGTTFSIHLPSKQIKEKKKKVSTKSCSNRIEMLNIEFSDIYSK